MTAPARKQVKTVWPYREATGMPINRHGAVKISIAFDAHEFALIKQLAEINCVSFAAQVRAIIERSLATERAQSRSLPNISAE